MMSGRMVFALRRSLTTDKKPPPSVTHAAEKIKEGAKELGSIGYQKAADAVKEGQHKASDAVHKGGEAIADASKKIKKDAKNAADLAWAKEKFEEAKKKGSEAIKEGSEWIEKKVTKK